MDTEAALLFLHNSPDAPGSSPVNQNGNGLSDHSDGAENLWNPLWYSLEHAERQTLSPNDIHSHPHTPDWSQ